MAGTGEVEQRVQARVERQGVLTKDDPPLWAIMDEAALQRVVGSPAIMHPVQRRDARGYARLICDQELP